MAADLVGSAHSALLEARDVAVEDPFHERRQLVIPTLREHSAIRRSVRLPALRSGRPYSALRCERRP